MESVPTILVVDDDQAIAELLRDFLEADGFRVATAGDAQSAQTVLAAQRVDCLLLDVMLPGQSGFDLCVEIPPSRVREVNEVAAAFTTMGEGLRAAVVRQAALEQERRLLIGAIAHDLRTPLFALRGYLEGLEHGLATTPEKVARYLAVCREQAAVLEQRITALFHYARLEYLAQPLRYETIHWRDLIERVIERIHPAAARKGVSVHMLSSSTPCLLEGDP
jgi:signal transduction histidine kinase